MVRRVSFASFDGLALPSDPAAANTAVNGAVGGAASAAASAAASTAASAAVSTAANAAVSGAVSTAAASKSAAAPKKVPADTAARRVIAVDPRLLAGAVGGGAVGGGAVGAVGAAASAAASANAASANAAPAPSAPVFRLFTDGAASGNGTRSPQAGFAVVFGDQSQFSGNVPTATFSVCDGRILIDPATPQLPTNNRAEKLAVAVAILAGIEFAPVGAVLEIVTDSELVVKTFLEYLPARLRRPKPEPLKNPDLLSAINSAIAAAERRGHSVMFRHTRAHQARPPPTATADAIALWLGNDQADRAAGAAKKPASAALASFGLGRLAGWSPFAPAV